jgi:hypothetical protein
MFDRNLIFDELNSLHHQAKKLLFGFKARIVERCADITTKLPDSRSQRRSAVGILICRRFPTMWN